MSYTDSSNGVTPASLEVDYVGLHIGLSVDAQAVLAKSGFVQALCQPSMVCLWNPLEWPFMKLVELVKSRQNIRRPLIRII